MAKKKTQKKKTAPKKRSGKSTRHPSLDELFALGSTYWDGQGRTTAQNPFDLPPQLNPVFLT